MPRKKKTSPNESRGVGSSGARREQQGAGGSASKKPSTAPEKKPRGSARSVSAAADKIVTKSPAASTPPGAKAAPSVRAKRLSPPKTGKSAGNFVVTGVSRRKTVPPKSAGADVVVSGFEPERGYAIIEFKGRRVRYTRAKTPEQVLVMADYLRARPGFASEQEMAEAFQVHPERLAAWEQGTELPNPQNAQLLTYVAVVVRELAEFLDPDVIPDWLATHQYTLGGETPVRALREGQLAEVLQAANATEHGAYI